MSQRLAIDASIIGYWGFDEALETDLAIDSSLSAYNLTVTSSSGTVPGRVGNSRRFDGTASYASVTQAALRLAGDLTLMAWVKLTSYNSLGTQLRTILSCGGPTSGDNSLYALTVTLTGALAYRHTSSSGEVVVTTAASTIRTGQWYFVAIRRMTTGGNQNVEIYVDNVLKSPVLITVNGVPQAMPVPPPAANASAIFSVGRSQREANSAFWDGYIDEVSVHNVVRAYQPYLIDSYYRAAVRAGTTKLTATNTVVAVSSYEMGAGVRWWCVERDKDLFVVKESPFGSFGPETQLTTVGSGNSSTVGKPELIYNSATDTLYVFFAAGNRIFKLTANSTDDPATINMPFTADTGGIIKSLDNADGGRLGDGAGQREFLLSDVTYVNRQPLKLNLTDLGAGALGDGAGQQATVDVGPDDPVIVFVSLPAYGFGFVIGPVNVRMGGYRAYDISGGAAVEMAIPVIVPDGRYFVAVSPRVYGRAFIAEALTPQGKKSGVFSDVAIDRFGEAELTALLNLRYGRAGDGADSDELGDGAGQREFLLTDMTYVNRTPLKFSAQDSAIGNLGDGAGQLGSVTNGSINRPPSDAGKVTPV